MLLRLSWPVTGGIPGPHLLLARAVAASMSVIFSFSFLILFCIYCTVLTLAKLIKDRIDTIK